MVIPSVKVLYCDFENIPECVFLDAKKQLPIQLLNKVDRYVKEEDKRARTISFLMLTSLLGKNSSLSDLKEGIYGKPYMPGFYNFNISHSHHMVVLSYSELAVGVDIEFIKPIEVETYDTVLHLAEKEAILKSDNPMTEFYKIWTRKESLLKCIGTGLHNECYLIDCLPVAVTLNDREWFFYELNLGNNYLSTLCTSVNNCQVLCENFVLR